MDLRTVLSDLYRMRLLVGVVLLLAALAAVSTQYRLPSMEPRSFQFGAAQTQLLVDSGASPLADVSQLVEPLATRAVLYARFMTSASMREAVAREAGLPFETLDVSAPFNVGEARFIREPPSERRANELLGEGRVYRMLLSAEEGLPIVTISTQAPTAEEAERIANAGVTALADYVRRLEQNTAPRLRIKIRRLGEARGGTVNDGADKIIAILAFLGVLTLGCMAILALRGVSRLVQERRAETLRDVEGIYPMFPESWESDGGGQTLGERPPQPEDGLPVAEPARGARSSGR